MVTIVALFIYIEHNVIFFDSRNLEYSILEAFYWLLQVVVVMILMSVQPYKNLGWLLQHGKYWFIQRINSCRSVVERTMEKTFTVIHDKILGFGIWFTRWDL